MPVSLKRNENFNIQHKRLAGDYKMNGLEIATDHYNIGYVVSGDRKTVLLDGYYTVHAGNVTMMAPYVYHRTVSLSEVPYERYQIKFSPGIVEPLIREIGQPAFDRLNACKVFALEEKTRQYMEQIFRDMCYEYNRKSRHMDLILQGMLNRLIITLLENGSDAGTTRYPAPLNRQVADAICYMENNYSLDPSLEETANQVYLSKYYFSHIFREQTGQTYSSYLNSVKLHFEQELLIKTQKTISQIAVECGFPSGNYLCDVFKKEFQIAPSTFRQQYRSRQK